MILNIGNQNLKVFDDMSITEKCEKPTPLGVEWIAQKK